MSPETIARIEKKDQLILSSKTFARIAKTYDLGSKRVIDIGCGYGEHMQRFGKSSVGITTRAVEVEYGKVKGRDIRIGNAEQLKETLGTAEKFDVIWCNNILEHLLSPHSFLVHLKEISHADTLLILGTPMIPVIPALTKLPRMRGALANVHINFFNYATYHRTVQFAGWKEECLRSFFFQSPLLDSCIKTIAPHLYLVAKNDATYRYTKQKESEWKEDALYQELLSIMGVEE